MNRDIDSDQRDQAEGHAIRPRVLDDGSGDDAGTEGQGFRVRPGLDDGSGEDAGTEGHAMRKGFLDDGSGDDDGETEAHRLKRG